MRLTALFVHAQRARRKQSRCVLSGGYSTPCSVHRQSLSPTFQSSDIPIKCAHCALSVHAQRARRKQSRRVLSMGYSTRALCDAPSMQAIPKSCFPSSDLPIKCASLRYLCTLNVLGANACSLGGTARALCASSIQGTLNVLGANNRAACSPGGTARALCAPSIQSANPTSASPRSIVCTAHTLNALNTSSRASAARSAPSNLPI
jgi:hypothetical protein